MPMPDFSVAERVALITGAGRGIGLAMAQTLAAGGAAVAIQDIDLPVAQAEVDAIHRAGGKALALGGDLTDLSLPEKLVEQTVAAFGKISILINNGSIQNDVAFVEHTIDDMRKQLDCNVVAVTRLCQLVLPAMQQAKWGRIINLGSIQGHNGNARMAAYAMSRAAMECLTKGLARSVARDGVTVNCIAPGWFDTYRNRHHLVDDEIKRASGLKVPAGRLGRPDDVAGLCLLLCSAAGEYITGQTIHVNGGLL